MSDQINNPTKLMTSEDVLALLPIGEKQLRNLINHKGLPCDGKGARRTFDWPVLLDWWVEYRMALAFKDGNGGNEDGYFGDESSENGGRPNEDIRAAMLRKTRAEADLKQLALSRQRSEVITIVDAKVRLDRMLGNLRTKLLSVSPKLANRVAGEKSRSGIESAIKDELENLCREISSGEIVGATEAETLPEISASADQPFTIPTNVEVLASLLVDYD